MPFWKRDIPDRSNEVTTRFVESGSTKMVVAEKHIGEQRVGTCMINVEADHTGYLSDVNVAEGYRHAGYGGELFQRAVEEAQRQGVTKFHSNGVVGEYAVKLLTRTFGDVKLYDETGLEYSPQQAMEYIHNGHELRVDAANPKLPGKRTSVRRR